MLSTANLTLQFSGKPLFENVSVKFQDGARYGLIGANGSGKSSLMKILSKQLEASSGSVVYDPHQTIATLGQDQFAFEEFSAVEAVMQGDPELWRVHQRRNHLYSLPEMSDEEGIEVAELEVKYAELDGYTAESRAEELLAGVGIPHDQHHSKMSEIAPGLKLRILLTQVIFADPDIMLLDEPTNNLDIDTIRWLEQVLTARKSTMIIISHDRHFLNTVCTHIADLDYGEVRMYPGNYDEYMTAAELVRERTMASNARKQAKIKELKTFVSRFSANAAKAKQATSRAKLIGKIELDEMKPSSRRNPYIIFTQDKKLHRLALETADLTNGFDSTPLFHDMSFIVEAAERVAIIGPNGIGKTTLLKTLLNEIPAQKGKIKWAEHADIGYIPQDHHDALQGDSTLLDWMWQWGGSQDDEQSIRGILGRMLFSGKDIEKKVSVLSGGERVRMLIGKLILQKHNVLVMDEPTNHLDMESIESLQVALDNFPGTLFLVSHDRELVSSLATRIIALTPEHDVIDYRGKYDDFLASQQVD